MVVALSLSLEPTQIGFLSSLFFFSRPPAHRPLAAGRGRTERTAMARESARERRPQWEISSGMGELIKVVSEEEEEGDEEKEEQGRDSIEKLLA